MRRLDPAMRPRLFQEHFIVEKMSKASTPAEKKEQLRALVLEDKIETVDISEEAKGAKFKMLKLDHIAGYASVALDEIVQALAWANKYVGVPEAKWATVE